MTDECSRAISFANSYFALVDGLAYGLEEHLAEDVSLDWFGKIVNGKRNVAAFMRINMTNSRHIFDEIMPASSMDQRTKRTYRRKHRSEKKLSVIGNINDSPITNGLNFSKLRIGNSNDAAKEKFETDVPTSVFLERMSGDRSDNIAENTTKRENNEKDPWISLIPKIQCELSISSSNPDESSMKFVRANGIVHIHRSMGPNKIRKWQSSTFVSGLPGQTFRRRCKLQVAYSWRNDKTEKCDANAGRTRNICAVKAASSETTSDDGTRINSREEAARGRKRWNSQEEEIYGTNDGSEPMLDPFEDFASLDDKQRFLECFEAGMTPKYNFTSAKYIGDRLIFDRTGGNESASKNFPTSFRFDYSIHRLVYESDARTDLSEEFEDRKSLSDTEKSV